MARGTRSKTPAGGRGGEKPQGARSRPAGGRGTEKPKGAWREAKKVGLYLAPEWWLFLSKESERRRQAQRSDSDYSSIVADGLRSLSRRRSGRRGDGQQVEKPRVVAWRSAKRAGLYLAMEWWSFLVAESAQRKQALRADNDYSSIVTDGLRLLRTPGK